MLLVFASTLFVSFAFAEVGEREASSSLDNAERGVISAYKATLKAEEAGANVSGLLNRLNEAEALLAHARIAYRSGGFDEVVRYASLCTEIGERVKIDADELWGRAYGSRSMDFWLAMAGSVLGIFVVGLGSFLSWRRFKRRYLKRILRMKPEVSSDES